MAEMNPPHHEMSPMRVLMKITKAEAPTLEEPSKWSPEFSDLLKQCLQKNPERRPSAKDILEVIALMCVGVITSFFSFDSIHSLSQWRELSH